ncbi:radical SAM additional 4Fe4S-binding SPASM domain-containing protein [Lishizhenia tianjinensis]|uniref:Radical SAM additional 4Fe4S-binding SPASM domain-containing protein n=1 Tax=Lishizhenia tianjinensis TaxID=477690 RepID=A0A1I6ZXJ6_9FLAO|nr:radical SAM/SPASM domain-containing protein [Lishizhenia tianjinensis]SFT67394.1 radical SAM additional 4Fe4S-binding SPASM domain-containing protein [Lishizhenia tianjinensis]
MNVADNINIIRHLTINRFWNLIKLGLSYQRAKLFKKFDATALPFAASIEPTTACNLSCPECPSGLKQFTRSTGKLGVEENKQMLRNIGKQLFYVNYYFQGEPFLNPNFLQLIKDAKRQRIYTATSTNAHFITEGNARDIVSSGLDRLIISIDGLTQETYEQYRKNGKLDKVIAGTKALVEAKRKLNSSTPHLIFQFLAVKPNEHEIPKVFELAKEMEIDEVRIKSAQLYDYKNGNVLIPENPKYSRYVKGRNGQYKPKYKLANKCWRMWSSTVLTWDGKVVPCCFDKDAKHVLGCATSTPFRRIWHSPAYQNFRKSVFTGRNQVEICKNCSEGAKVWV